MTEPTTKTATGGPDGTETQHVLSYDELVTSHIPLVGHLVRETMSRVPAHVNRDDLTSAGLAALAAAAKTFEHSRGVTFGRYAATRVRGAILDELRAVDWASRSVRRRARQVDETRSALATQLGRPPTDQEVASSLGLSLAEVVGNADDVSRAQVLSLHGFGETSIDDLVASRAPSPEQLTVQRERVGYLVDAVAELPERLRAVVEHYFFAERPMAEIAELLGVTESRVSQMRSEALALLKDALNSALEPSLVTKLERPEGCAARRRDAYFAAVASRRTASDRISTRSWSDSA